MSEALPQGWASIPLADLGTWYGGGTPSKSNPLFWTGGTVPWLSPKDMSGGTILGTRDRITAVALDRSSAKLVPPNSVVFVVRSGILERKFPVSLVRFETALNQDMKAIVPFAGIDSRWLTWALRNLERVILNNCRKAGTTVASIETTALKQLKIPIPPLAEQKRIVEVLEDSLSRLDVGESGVELGLRKAEQLRKSVIVDAVPTKGRDNWKLLTVADAGIVDLGRQRHPNWHTGPNMRPYLRVANVFEDRFDVSDIMQMDFPDEIFAKFKLRPGDILLNEGQSPEYLGRPAMYRGFPEEVAFTNSLLRFRARDGIEPEWALLVFRRHLHARRFLKETRITTNIAHLSAGRFKSVEFPVPPLTEQKAIVATTMDRLDDVERLKTGLRAALERAESLRASLLKKAFTGQLVPQDPGDEPVARLLARVSAMSDSKFKVMGVRRPKTGAPRAVPLGVQGELPL
ncbi:restriction endonuclease subunit S [Nocardia sp. NPDC004168]|uniref:restriction endonuclease subunit S n=1 Tax=Nocardia sp. NPDC004168 TaxID=3154452 RepID=UPI0033AC225C